MAKKKKTPKRDPKVPDDETASTSTATTTSSSSCSINVESSNQVVGATASVVNPMAGGPTNSSISPDKKMAGRGRGRGRPPSSSNTLSLGQFWGRIETPKVDPVTVGRYNLRGNVRSPTRSLESGATSKSSTTADVKSSINTRSKTTPYSSRDLVGEMSGVIPTRSTNTTTIPILVTSSPEVESGTAVTYTFPSYSPPPPQQPPTLSQLCREIEQLQKGPITIGEGGHDLEVPKLDTQQQQGRLMMMQHQQQGQNVPSYEEYQRRPTRGQFFLPTIRDTENVVINRRKVSEWRQDGVPIEFDQFEFDNILGGIWIEGVLWLLVQFLPMLIRSQDLLLDEPLPSYLPLVNGDPNRFQRSDLLPKMTVLCFPCPYCPDGCRQSFSTDNALARHVQRDHKGQRYQHEQRDTTTPKQQQVPIDEEEAQGAVGGVGVSSSTFESDTEVEFSYSEEDSEVGDDNDDQQQEWVNKNVLIYTRRPPSPMTTPATCSSHRPYIINVNPAEERDGASSEATAKSTVARENINIYTLQKEIAENERCLNQMVMAGGEQPPSTISNLAKKFRQLQLLKNRAESTYKRVREEMDNLFKSLETDCQTTTKDTSKTSKLTKSSRDGSCPAEATTSTSGTRMITRQDRRRASSDVVAPGSVGFERVDVNPLTEPRRVNKHSRLPTPIPQTRSRSRSPSTWTALQKSAGKTSERSPDKISGKRRNIKALRIFDDTVESDHIEEQMNANADKESGNNRKPTTKITTTTTTTTTTDSTASGVEGGDGFRGGVMIQLTRLPTGGSIYTQHGLRAIIGRLQGNATSTTTATSTYSSSTRARSATMPNIEYPLPVSSRSIGISTVASTTTETRSVFTRASSLSAARQLEQTDDDNRDSLEFQRAPGSTGRVFKKEK